MSDFILNLANTYYAEPEVQNMAVFERYLFLYLLTNRRMNECGCYVLPTAVMESETAIPHDAIVYALEKLQKQHKLAAFSQSTAEVLIRKWISPMTDEELAADQAKSIHFKPFQKFVEKALEDLHPKEEEPEEDYPIPTFDDVRKFAKAQKLRTDYERFYQHYEARNWRYSDGTKVKVWQEALIHWHGPKDISPEAELMEKYDKAALEKALNERGDKN